jgi:hypothetical protein
MDITIVMLTSVLTAEVNLLHRGLLAVDGRMNHLEIHSSSTVLRHDTRAELSNRIKINTYQIYVTVDSAAAQVNENEIILRYTVLLFKENGSRSMMFPPGSAEPTVEPANSTGSRALSTKGREEGSLGSSQMFSCRRRWASLRRRLETAGLSPQRGTKMLNTSGICVWNMAAGTALISAAVS